MGDANRMLIVISILEGKNFPKRDQHQLIVEASFDGELLATDPVAHIEFPVFTQELAWELDKRSLHQHRMQRSSIKLQVYSADVHTTKKEPVGYIVLHLRSATLQQQNVSWHPLLHSKYSKNKPEIQVGLYLSEEDQANGLSKDKPKTSGQTTSSIATTDDMEFDAKQLKPVLNESGGFYQIGPVARCSESFILSVTVSFAANLPQLVPSVITLPRSGFFFYFCLLGNDVTNEVFSDLFNPTFPPERASVKIRSSIEALRQFFASQPGLEIHLCCGDQSLGSAEISLASLLRPRSMEVYMKPVTIEGAFQLIPPKRWKQHLPALPEDLTPLVGVSVVLRKEDQGIQTTVTVPSSAVDNSMMLLENEKNSNARQIPARQEPNKKVSENSEEKLENKAERPVQQSSTVLTDERMTRPSAKSSKDEKYTKPAVSNQEKASKAQSTEDYDDYSNSFEAESQATRDSHGSRDNKMTKEAILSDDPTSLSTTEHHIAVSPTMHHFTCTVDLRSLQGLSLQQHVNIYLRYCYPFFGSVAPVMTHPPVQVNRGIEAFLPHGFCAFDFATTQQQLAETLKRLPLIIEMWDADKSKGQNVLLGVAEVPLANLLSAPKTAAQKQQSPDSKDGFRQVWSDRTPVLSVNDRQKLADLHVLLFLEDWGPLPDGRIVHLDQEQTNNVNKKPSPCDDASQSETPRVDEEKQVPQDPRETLEYKMAMELEMWKAQQEAVFEKQLAEKESRYMKTLSEEWKKRDKERELLVKKKLAEYQQLEDQVRKALADLEKRERLLANKEHEVDRLKSDLEHEHERKMTEMREASRRVKDDCDHQVQLERKKIAEMEEHQARQKRLLVEQEAKFMALEREFMTYKEQINTKKKKVPTATLR